ncbi:MAG: hypothetical protein ABFE07_08330 [Armatimonadia bacterium]
MTQEQRELLRTVPADAWVIQVWIGKDPDGLWHVSLDRSSALCGVELEKRLTYDRWLSIANIPAGYIAQHPDSCPRCNAALQEIAAVALAALTVDDVPAAGAVAAPGHEDALAELAAENERLRGALRLACAELAEGCCPKNDDAYCGEATEEFCNEACGDQRYPDCLVQKYLAEAANAGEGE